MGQETRLKTIELKTGQQLVRPSSQALQNFPETQTQMNTKQEEIQVPTLHKQQNSRKESVQPPNTLPLPFHSNLCPSPSEPNAIHDDSDDKEEKSGDRTQDEVPCRLFSELACPVALSFSEPAYEVDPLRVGVPSSLEPDLYYTAPSTPIKMSSCSSHLKHHSYPGTPACPLSPGSPSDSEDLCSPLTSPSGSYITAEGGSWTSSYTSSTSPSASPNLLVIEEAQEAPACFVASLSEIGDEVGDDKLRAGLEREVDRAGELCTYRSEDYVSQAILEEDEALKEEEVKISKEGCRPCWVNESMLHQRSSSSHSSDSQDNGGGSESSLCPLEESTVGREEYPRAKQACLKLPSETCVSQDTFGQLEDLRTTMITPDIEESTLPSSSLSPESPMIPLDDFCQGAFGRLCPNSYMFSQAVYTDDIPEDERMIPASLLSFPLNTSLIFRADSMEITLFPTEDANEIEEGEEKDVNAYAAGEEEADVEDDDDEDDDVVDFDDNIEIDNNAEDEDSDSRDEATKEAKVEVKVVEEEKEENENEEEEEEEDDDVDEDDSDIKAVGDRTDEDSSASFLHSLSETSITDGLDEACCFQVDTDDSLDSASYNGEEDESLYSTERHAQSLEPTQEDPDQTDAKQDLQYGTNMEESQMQHVSIPQNTDGSNLFNAPGLSLSTAPHCAGNSSESTIMNQLVSSHSQLDVELKHATELGHTSSMDFEESTEGQTEKQEPSLPSARLSGLQEPSNNPDIAPIMVGGQDNTKSLAFCGQPTNTPHFDSATFTFALIDDSNISHASASVSQEIVKLDPAMKLAEATTKMPDLDLKQSSDTIDETPIKEHTRTSPECVEKNSDNSDEEPSEKPENDSYKLLIKPRLRQAKNHMTIGASRLALAKSFSMKVEVSGESNTTSGSNIHEGSDTGLHQKHGETAAKSICVETRNADTGHFQNKTSVTNDLNKGVPLLSCPKDPTSNPSNIPLSTFTDLIPEVADNLALTPEHCLRDSAQDNLRENALSTDEGTLGAAGSPHSPLAISPKRENSETDVSREISPVAAAWRDDRMGLGFGLGLGLGTNLGVWGAGEALSLSLEKKFELESESLLMCDAKGQSAEMVVTPNLSDHDCKIYENVMGFVLDEEDNNSEGEVRKEAADHGSKGRETSESNIMCWKSIREISIEGGHGSSTLPKGNPNRSNNLDSADVQPQENWRNSDNNNNSAFNPLDEAMYGNLNSLSEDVRHQGGSVGVRESLSNIPLEEIPNPEGHQADIGVSFPITDTSMHKDVTKQIFSSSDNRKLVNDRVKADSESAVSWLNGSFGSFNPKSKPKESGLKANHGNKANARTYSDIKTVESEDESQRKDVKSALTSRLLGEPKTNDAFGGQQQVVCNSGDEVAGKKGEETKKKGEKKGKKNKWEMKTAPEQNYLETFECRSLKGEDCTKKPTLAKRGRRGRQNKNKVSKTGVYIDSSPESVHNPKKATLISTIDNSSNKTINNNETGPKENYKCESLKASLGMKNSSQLQRNDSDSDDAKGPKCHHSATHASHNRNVMPVIPEPQRQLEALDNRPPPNTLSQSHIGTLDINDNNIVLNHSPHPHPNPASAALPCQSSSTRPALPSSPPPASESEDDLPTPVQESQPVQMVGPLLCSACTTTRDVFNPSVVPKDSQRQGLSVLQASTLALSEKKPTQALPSPGIRTQGQALSPDSVPCPQSPSFLQCQAQQDFKQSKLQKRSCTWSAQDRLRGELC